MPYTRRAIVSAIRDQSPERAILIQGWTENFRIAPRPARLLLWESMSLQDFLKYQSTTTGEPVCVGILARNVRLDSSICITWPTSQTNFRCHACEMNQHVRRRESRACVSSKDCCPKEEERERERERERDSVRSLCLSFSVQGITSSR